MEVTFYSPEHRLAWNQFLDEVKSPFFFYKREFVEYHSDRFQDASTIVWEGGKIVALIPCSRTGDQIVAHGGLTFGSFVLSDQRNSFFRQVFASVVEFWKQSGISDLIYKKPPFFFQGEANQNDIYELWRNGAHLIKRDLTTHIDLSDFEYSKGRKSTIKKASKLGIEISVGESTLEPFYQLLVDVLHARHGVKPVHSMEELRLLTSRFPENIRASIAISNGETLAGVLLFDFGNVLHTQYLCTSEEGKKLGALDFLLDFHIQTSKESKSFLSFGISTEHGGSALNEGLILQKESFGGIDCCVDTYSFRLSGFKALNS